MDELRAIQIESSTLCNGHCVFCPRFDMKRVEGEMTDDLFHKIVGEAKEMGVKMIMPFLNGEPFLFSRLFEWLDYLKENDINFTLFTNASALTALKAEKINKYSNCANIIFSIHGYDKRSYEAQMGLSYMKVKANVEYFRSIAKVPYQIYILDTSINHDGISKFMETWGPKAYFAKYNNWAGQRPSNMNGNKLPCDRILNEMTIYWDGRVNLCCMDIDGGVILGDVNTQTVKEIWESNQWMRDKHEALDFDLPLCRDCNKNIV